MTSEERAQDIVESMGAEATMPHLWAIKIKKAIEDERAACAKIAADIEIEMPHADGWYVAIAITKAIRARGNGGEK